MAEAHELQGGSISAVAKALQESMAYQQMLEAEKAAKDQAAAQEEAVQSARIDALVEAAYIVASADGRYSNEESERLIGRVGALTNNMFVPDSIASMAESARERVSAEGLEARARAIADVIQDPELRESTLLVASSVGWLDGGVGQKEGLALQALARAFDIPIHNLHKIMGQARG